MLALTPDRLAPSIEARETAGQAKSLMTSLMKSLAVGLAKGEVWDGIWLSQRSSRGKGRGLAAE